MKKSLIAAAILALASSPAVFAQASNLQGGSSNASNVIVGPSDFPPLIADPTGYSGLQMVKPNGAWSSTIDIFDGPITQVTNKSTVNQAGPYYANMPILPIKIAQVWHYQDQSPYADYDNVDIYSLRQVTTPPLSGYPRFGGLVVAKVQGTGKDTGNGVYFGEWSQAVSSPSSGNSTDLNMADASRTVWFAGDNAVTSMPNLVNAMYNVTGIRQTGVGTNLPYDPNLYAGVLTANYQAGGSNNTLSGDLVRAGDPTVSINANILANGQFVGTDNNGRFYNDATALAGIYTGGGVGDHIAFGGSRQ